MIPVTPAPQPPAFANKVVVPAKKWARQKGWSWDDPPPQGHAKDLPSHWTRCLDDLHAAYDEACAYLSVHMHRTMQDSSVDHFHPKSLASLRLAYDWNNYRLASRPMNTNKGEHQDVIDPFLLPEGLFQLHLLNGRIQINTALAKPGSPLHRQARATINRLKLNNGQFRELRLEYITEYLENCLLDSADARESARNKLAIQSPFIYQEVLRQGL